MKKITIIGAGNMGGAIARGLLKTDAPWQVTVTNPSQGKLDDLKSEFPAVNISNDNAKSVCDSDIVVLAVKPWIIPEVMEQIADKLDFERQILVSLAAGITVQELADMTKSPESQARIFRVMPNTAIAVGKSMTFVAGGDFADDDCALIVNGLFATMGQSAIIPERMMSVAMALCSCGIAYAMRYVRAATEGAVELGMYPDKAKEYMLQTLEGAVAVLRSSGANPESEIDRVTTPGGTTIRGLNAMEQAGFTSAVIAGLKASAK